MKKTSFLQGVLLTGAVLFAPVSLAEWSMGLGLTTNYLAKSNPQTSDGPAVQGKIEYSHESGLYLGTWVSSINFGTPAIEVDLYIGYGGSAGIFGYDISYWQYIYPDLSNQTGSTLLVDGITRVGVGENYGDLIFDFSVSDFIFGFQISTDAQANENTFNEVGDIYAYVGYKGSYSNGWSMKAVLGGRSFTTGDPEKVVKELEDADGNLTGEFEGGGNPLFYSNGVISVSKSSENYGTITFALSKIFNWVPAGGFRIPHGDKEKIRPVLSWGISF